MTPTRSEALHQSVEATPRRVRSGPAELFAVLPNGQVQVVFDGDANIVTAQLAAAGYADPRSGDRVLAMTDDFGTVWVVGVIRADRGSLLDEVLAAEPDESDTSSSIERQEVRDRSGRLLFEYDPVAGKAVLHVPAGDLELSVPDGALRMKARDGVEVETEGDLRMRGGGGLELESSRAEGPASRVVMRPGELSLVGAALTVAADRAEILASKIGLRAHQVESHVDRVRNVVKVLDLRAGRIIERAKDVYRETEGLSQTRAGRLRMVAQKAVQIVGENTLLKARDRVKVKGERIHLA